MINKFKKGDAVEWLGYHGVVSKVLDNDCYTVVFDDGQCDLHVSNLEPLKTVNK